MTDQIILFFIIYETAVNIIAILLYKIDKEKAKKRRYRISEGTLIMIAAIGGSIGAFLGMYMFHHKTQKPLFVFGIPFIILLQGYVIYLCYIT